MSSRSIVSRCQPNPVTSILLRPTLFPLLHNWLRLNPRKDEIVFRNQDQLEQGKEDTQNLCQPSILSHCNKNSPIQLHRLDKCSVLLKQDAQCAVPCKEMPVAFGRLADASTFSVKQQFHPGSGHRNSWLTGEREKGHISLSLSLSRPDFVSFLSCLFFLFASSVLSPHPFFGVLFSGWLQQCGIMMFW